MFEAPASRRPRREHANVPTETIDREGAPPCREYRCAFSTDKANWNGRGRLNQALSRLHRLLLCLALSLLPTIGFAQTRDHFAPIVDLPNVPLQQLGSILVRSNGSLIVLQQSGAVVLRGLPVRWEPVRSNVRLRPEAAMASAGMEGNPLSAVVLGSDGAATDVQLLSLNGLTLSAAAMWKLPASLRSPLAAWRGDSLLVAGVGQDNVPALYSRAITAGSSWQRQPAWPSGVRALTLGVQERGIFVTLVDGNQWRWSAQAGWKPAAAAPGTVISGFPISAGQTSLLYAVEHRSGAALFSYNAVTDAWAKLHLLPSGVWKGGGIINRRLVLMRAEPNSLHFVGMDLTAEGRHLSFIDEAIIVVYMAAMLLMGLYFYRKTSSDNSNDFFLGNRSIPFWAAGLSMFASTIGSVNYLAIPAKSFDTDWQYIMSKFTYVGALIVVAIWLAPFLRRLNIVSVYSYLENRFSTAIRLLSSALWIIMQLTARMGIILYLPALAINVMTGFDIVACIFVVGIFTIIYTALGGMRAVVWTDVVQVFVLTGGALFTIGYIVYMLGWNDVVQTTAAFDKTRMLNTSFDVKQPTIWAFLALAILDGILCFPKDQIVMQRVLATSSTKEATWSILTFAAVLLPSAIMFYAIGTVLFAFYRARPEGLDPLMPIDAVFPTFIGTELPPGVVGLVVAGVLAAAMGTLSGIINSVATLLSVDFYERFVPNRSQRQIVRFSEVVSVLVGLIGIAVAILLSRLNIHSLLDLTIELGGVFGGSFAGAYPLGIFSTRANWQGAAIGIIVSAIITIIAWSMNAVHPYLYLPLAIAISLVVGYFASLLFPRPDGSLEGLTVFTRRQPSATVKS